MKTKRDLMNISIFFRMCAALPVALAVYILSVIPVSRVASQDTASAQEKLAASLYITYRVSDSSRSVKIRVTKKVNRRTKPVDDLTSPVNLYLNEVKDDHGSDGTGWIGKLHINNEGTGTLTFSEKLTGLISGMHKCTFIAKIDADPKYEDMEESITVSDAKIIIDYSGDDSIKTASAKVEGWNDSVYVPVSGTEVKLGIKRTFSMIPVAEGLVTDENGMVSATLPLDIPANHDSTITLVAKIEDHETYGTAEATKTVPWSVMPNIHQDTGRSLWASAANAPLPLVISSIAIIFIIWGTIFYLVYLLIKINKIGKEQSS